MTDDVEILRERFSGKWALDKETGCWLWTASTAGKGYGQIKLPGRRQQIYAHRLSYVLHVGSVGPAQHVLHHCDTPRCVNPEHLFLGDAKINGEDMAAKKRSTWGEKNAGSRLIADQVRQIRALGGKKPSAELAEMFSVHPQTIGKILRGERWAQLDIPPAAPIRNGRRRAGRLNGKAKLTEKQVQQIRRLSGTISHAEIAKLFDVTRLTIGRIVRGERWTHLK